MKWISIKDKLPEHEKTILAYTEKGQCVCIFISSIKMNESLIERGYPMECVDLPKNPYYFCSQEIRKYILEVVTHWMPLPEMPK